MQKSHFQQYSYFTHQKLLKSVNRLIFDRVIKQIKKWIYLGGTQCMLCGRWDIWFTEPAAGKLVTRNTWEVLPHRFLLFSYHRRLLCKFGEIPQMISNNILLTNQQERTRNYKSRTTKKLFLQHNKIQHKHRLQNKKTTAHRISHYSSVKHYFFAAS